MASGFTAASLDHLVGELLHVQGNEVAAFPVLHAHS